MLALRVATHLTGGWDSAATEVPGLVRRLCVASPQLSARPGGGE